VVEKLGSDIVSVVEDAEVKEELKKVNRHLRQIIQLKKQLQFFMFV
jgi:biotin synthase-related radical SAM superfamily protein